MGQSTSITTQAMEAESACMTKHANHSYDSDYCDTVFDGYLCWPPTPVGQVSVLKCPAVRLSDTSKLAHRYCDSGGWLGRDSENTSLKGWTNYTGCFPLLVQTLFGDIYGSIGTGKGKFKIALLTRYLEIIGFTISLIALILSMMIFIRFRSLRNSRTRIHLFLFSAMVVQVIIRLVLYVDQAIVRNWYEEEELNDNSIAKGIENVPYLCEGFYTLLEYTISCTFMWMLIEGIHLHRLVSARVLFNRISFAVFYVLGWGVPAAITIIWAAMNALFYEDGNSGNINKCWYGYNFHNLYWILQGPRLGVIALNMVFLLHIMVVIIIKLRRTVTTEMQKIRKGVRAALVLLPLLGITNILSMIEAPLNGPVYVFAIWSFTTHFLRAFQGTFLAVIYCFLNAEVRQVLRKYYANYKAMKARRRRRQETFGDLVEEPTNRSNDEEKGPGTIAMRTFRYKEYTPSASRGFSDTEVVAGLSKPSNDEQKVSGAIAMRTFRYREYTPSTSRDYYDTEAVAGPSKPSNDEQKVSGAIAMRTFRYREYTPSTSRDYYDTEAVAGPSKPSNDEEKVPGAIPMRTFCYREYTPSTSRDYSDTDAVAGPSKPSNDEQKVSGTIPTRTFRFREYTPSTSRDYSNTEAVAGPSKPSNDEEKVPGTIPTKTFRFTECTPSTSRDYSNTEAVAGPSKPSNDEEKEPDSIPMRIFREHIPSVLRGFSDNEAVAGPSKPSNDEEKVPDSIPMRIFREHIPSVLRGFSDNEAVAGPSKPSNDEEKVPDSIPMRIFREHIPSVLRGFSDNEAVAGPSKPARETVVQFTIPPTQPRVVGVEYKTDSDISRKPLNYRPTPKHLGRIKKLERNPVPRQEE